MDTSPNHITPACVCKAMTFWSYTALIEITIIVPLTARVNIAAIQLINTYINTFLVKLSHFPNLRLQSSQSHNDQVSGEVGLISLVE